MELGLIMGLVYKKSSDHCNKKTFPALLTCED